MWSPQWEFEYDSKTNSIRATKESLCCPSKCIVAFKRCLLIKTQQKRIIRRSACSESRHTTPIKAPIHLKAISRQRQLFRSSPPCRPPFAPQQEYGRVCVWSPSLPLERPACSWCQSLLHQNAGSTHSAKALTRLCPPVCLPDWRVSIGDTAVHRPAGPMKSLFDSSLDWLSSPRHPGCQSSTFSGLITSVHIKHSYSSISRCAADVLRHYWVRKEKTANNTWIKTTGDYLEKNSLHMLKSAWHLFLKLNHLAEIQILLILSLWFTFKSYCFFPLV